MKFFKYLLIAIVVIGFTACGESKTSSDRENESESRSFKVDAGEDVTVEVNQTLTVLGLVVSEDGVDVQSYMWTKDNEILSREASLVYIPRTVGKDTLTLTAITNDGRTATDSLVLTVTEKVIENIPPKVELGVYRTIDINSSVTFTAEVSDSDGLIVKYVWTKNNEVVSTDENYSYVPTEFGEVSLGLSVSDDDGAITTDTLVVLITERAFITEWKTEDKKITIPINEEEKFDFTVEWGDGTLDTDVSNTIEHEYEVEGTYVVRVTGLFPSINFGKLERKDNKKLTAVKQWGDTLWSSMQSAFKHCRNMKILTHDVPNLSKVKDMSSMFSDVRDLTVNNINLWDVSKVEDMHNMFELTRNFNQDIGNWDVGNVRNMTYMFYETEFNQDIGDWNVSNVTNMGSIFGDSTALSIANYDKLLIGWSKLTLQHNVIFDENEFKDGLNYGSDEAKEARELIINNFAWTFYDATGPSSWY